MLRLEVDAVLFRACVHAALRATRRKIGANIVRFQVARGAVVEDILSARAFKFYMAKGRRNRRLLFYFVSSASISSSVFPRVSMTVK